MIRPSIQMKSHLPDKVKCSFILPGIISVATLCKNSSEGYPAGNGDAILVDLKRKIFAVADGPERNTIASRDFLIKFSHMIDGLKIYSSGATFSDKEVSKFQEKIITNCNHLIKGVDCFKSTTFTCLLLIPGSNKLSGMVLHNGDSCIYRLNVNEKKTSMLNKVDFFFIGRSSNLSQIKFIQVDEGDRFLLCTDGLHDLIRNSNAGFEELMIDYFCASGEFADMTDLIFNKSLFPVNNIKLSDDIGIIALNPSKLLSIHSKLRLILGGTTVGQEVDLKKRVYPGVSAEFCCHTDKLVIFPY